MWLTALFLFCEVGLGSAGGFPPYRPYRGPLRPGTVITKDNCERYLPELKKLLPRSKILWYVDYGLRRGIVTMPIVETRYFPPSKGYQEATRRYAGTCRIGEGNELIGWVAGTPFPKPRNAVELAWDCYPDVSHGSSADDTGLYKTIFLLFSRGKLERTFVWCHYKKKYMGRTDIPPLPCMPEARTKGILSKESFVITEPFDVKGFLQIRIRYWNIRKPDDAYAYIPALRRVRRMTGADVTDPILGSDALNDDFEVWRQKLNPRMTFEVLAIRDFLVPRTYRRRPFREPLRFVCPQVEWELRPLYVLQVNTNDPNYVYSKRVLYVDVKEGNYTIYWGEEYDQRGRLFRANGHAAPADEVHRFPGMRWETGGLRNLYAWCYMNYQTHHFTIFDSWPRFEPVDPEEYYTIRGLLRKVH